jgi:glutathione synthase/RimK-type ligase-like ATP-grasp enzyme
MKWSPLGVIRASKRYDITLLTDARYVQPIPGDWYVENIILEDTILRAALEQQGLRVHRTHWDDPEMDWTQTHYAVFRTTWDYFDRFAEFTAWLEATGNKTEFLNPLSLVRWNMDKHYLGDLQQKGIRIPPTVFIEAGDARTLSEIMHAAGWKECVLKPAVGGAGRHTYRLNLDTITEYEALFEELIAKEAFLLQEFMHQVPTKGEITLMVFDGQFTHAVLKKAKPGDFRVQDDFDGTVHDYVPTSSEIAFAEGIMRTCSTVPIYGRVDIIWDNENHLCVSELELIEPELWFRNYPAAAEKMAHAIKKHCFSLNT